MKAILREFWDSRLFESITSIVYHISKFPITNLKENRLTCSLHHGSDINSKFSSKKHFWFLSVARSLQSSYMPSKYDRCGIIFELDGNKLNNKFHGKAFNYFAYSENEDEAEDRIYLNESHLNNLDKYLKRIIVPIYSNIYTDKIRGEGEIDRNYSEHYLYEIIEAIEYGKKYNVKVDFMPIGEDGVLPKSKPFNYEKLSEIFLETFKKNKNSKKEYFLPSGEALSYRQWKNNYRFYSNQEKAIIFSVFYLFFFGVLPEQFYRYIPIGTKDGKRFIEINSFEYIDEVPIPFRTELFLKMKKVGVKNPSREALNDFLQENFSWNIGERPDFLSNIEVDTSELEGEFSDEAKEYSKEMLSILNKTNHSR